MARSSPTSPPDRGAFRPGGILTLDVATTTGWAYAYPGDVPHYDSHRMAPVGAGIGEVLTRMETWLGTLIQTYRPRWIVYESPYVPRPPKFSAAKGQAAPIFRSTPSIDMAVIRRLCAMCAKVEEIVWSHRGADSPIKLREVTTAEWFGTLAKGVKREKGRGWKKAMTIELCELHGWTPKDDNAADALGILVHAELVIAQLARPKIVRMDAGPLFQPSTGAIS